VTVGLTALISDTASFVIGLTVLVLDLTGVLRQRPGRRAMLTGLLIMNGGGLIDMITQERGGSHAWQLAATSTAFAMAVAGVGIVLAGVFGPDRERRRAQRAGHPRE
jgi:hypothetical protein